MAQKHDVNNGSKVDDAASLAVPLPDHDNVLLEPPTEAESRETARGVASAVTSPDGLTELQVILIEALFKAMTNTAIDVRSMEPMSASELAWHLARRDLQFRTRGVQVMLLCALVLSATVTRRPGTPTTLEPCMSRASCEAPGTQRWMTRLSPSAGGRSAICQPARWAGRVWEMYQARGFVVPGLPGSAPLLLAQHDWVHVLADYGTTVESELEVFALIARANDDMRAFSLPAMVVSLFETGYLRTGAGLFEADSGHLTRNHAVAVRMADAMYRGARCRDEEAGSDSVDFLQVDWFSLAYLSLDEARARFRLEAKSADAVAAGSVGPWEPGGISPFQERAGRRMASREGAPCESYGAEPSESR